MAAPTPNPCGQFGERLAFTQAGEDQQGLLPGTQLPPARPDRGPVAADDPGHEGEGLTGQGSAARQKSTATGSLTRPATGDSFVAIELVHDPGFDAYGFVPLVFRIPSFPLTRAGAQPEEGTINITIANPAGQRRVTADLGRSEG